VDTVRLVDTVRKGTRRALLGAGPGTLLGLAGSAPGDAKKKRRKKRNKRKKRQQQPSTVARIDATCPPTQRLGASAIRVAQTFRARRTGQLTSASVYLSHVLVAGADLDVEVWSVNSANEPSAVLSGVTIADLEPFSGGQEKLTAAFPTPANVVAGLRYALVVTANNEGDFVLLAAQGNPYPDGGLFAAESVKSPFKPIKDWDLAFETVVTA
jgi:hypothetical protein